MNKINNNIMNKFISNKKPIAIFAFLFLFSFSLSSQTITIKARVLDSRTKEALPFVNCVILSMKDTTKQLSGAASDTNGVVILEKVKKENLRLIFSSTGYTKKYLMIKPFDFKTSQIDIGDVLLQRDEKSLMAIEITAQKDRIKLDADKMTMTIDDNTQQSAQNCFELLKKAPGIAIDNDDNLKLNGKSGVLIQFQGRDMNLPWKSMVQILKGIPSSQVDKFEIITNPSAKYDAQGVAGIINILFKQDKNQGFNASLGTNLFYTDLPSLMGDVNLNYVDNKWTTSFSFSASSWKQRVENSSDRKIGFLMDTILMKSMTNTDYTFRNYNLNFGADYSIDKKNSVGLYFTYSKNETPPLEIPSSTIISNLIRGTNQYTDSLSYISNNFMNNKTNNYLLSANYKHLFDTLGQELSFDVSFISNDNNEISNADNKYFNLILDPNNPYQAEFLENTTNNKYYSIVGKADYFLPITKTLSLETGLKTAFTKVDNDFISFKDKINQDNMSNNFIYSENINALYASMKKSFNEKTSLRVGLRLENTIIEGKQIKNDSIFKQNYTNVFPNISLSHQFSSTNTLNLAYNMRISRPSYDNLNPFKVWTNDFTYTTGNPMIKPEYTHNISLQHTFMYVLFSSLTYSYTKDVVTQVPLNEEGSFITYTIPENIQNSHNLNLSISTALPIRKWMMFVMYLSGNYTNNTSDKKTLSVDNKILTFMGYGSLNFTLPKKYKLDISGYYTSPGIFGVIKYGSFYGLNINANKTFFKELLTVRVGVNNILSSRDVLTEFNYQGADFKQHTKTNRLMFVVGLKINIGKQNNMPQNKNKDDDFNQRTSGENKMNQMQGGAGTMQ
ncbi:MAG: TonB-dependent receptor [Bacteroidales bacterium]|jgi:hypothetical protein|nr:TonB-dependent receptor [Bacteroidales bacterium]